MLADRTFFRRLSTFEHITAVTAFPHEGSIFLETRTFANIVQQLQISAFVARFNLGYLPERVSYILEPFLFGNVKQN